MYLYLLVALFATTIGATAGIGGGVIIKPLLDLIGDYDVVVISILSSATILSMAVVSTIQQMRAGLKITKTIVLVTIGAVGGGVLGSVLLSMLTKGLESNVVTTVQSIILIILLVFCIFHEKLPKTQVQNPVVKGGVGLMLGVFSSFLGIGGGPVNVAVLWLVFNIELKYAARISIFIILFSQIAGLIMKGASGMISSAENYVMLLVMIPAAIAGGFLGACLNRKLSEKSIRILYQCTVILVILICLNNAIQIAV